VAYINKLGAILKRQINMKKISKTLTISLLLFVMTNCNNSDKQISNDKTEETKNTLEGIIYRDKNEIKELLKYEDVGGAVIEFAQDTANNMDFGISQFMDTINNKRIILFEKFIEEKGNPKPKYQIIDTLNIDNLKENENVEYCNCRQDTLPDSEIIAIVEIEDKEYYNKIRKAWRADTKTGKIVPIIDTKKINCETAWQGE
jgi:hypothetical protein